MLGVSVALLAVVAYLVLTRREQIIELAVTPQKLLYATLGLLVLGVAWIVVIITSHRALRPGTASEATRVIGAAFVGVLCFAVAVPTAMGVQTARTQRDLVKSVFAGKDSESATRPTVKNKKNPWAAKPRLNVLLLGADDGPDRDGVRTDTVIVASIDTKTGDTSLISLTRN